MLFYRVALTVSGPLFFLILFLSCPILVLSQNMSENYIYVNCSNEYNYTPSSQFETNLRNLLEKKFYGQISLVNFFNDTEGEDPDKVYGLYLCRGDVEQNICRSCVNASSCDIITRCSCNKEAVIWYDECMVRYSYKNFFSKTEQWPSVYMWNNVNVTDVDEFNWKLRETFDDVLAKNMIATFENAAAPIPLYATTVANISSSVTLYMLVQCTRDLSLVDCQTCLRAEIGIIPNFPGGKVRTRVLGPSCHIWYDVNPFFGKPRQEFQETNIISNQPGDETWAISPAMSPGAGVETDEGSKRGRLNFITIVASLSAIFGLGLLCSGGVFLWRRRNSQENADHNQNSQILELLGLGGISDDYCNENFQDENGVRISLEFPSFQLDVLLAATNQFSVEAKLGQGGFGPVYKGKLPDGEEIAVKRLSRTSVQGLSELKNEVMLIAKLQHRNLVRLLGCCLEQDEKLLVYEYMPNRSLDLFLFGSSQGLQLDWQKRLDIINGIARGIVYLHEDSRLRIIHRDLKASNVLLDHEMNPKISDFGMARIFCGNQSQVNVTNTVVGTYGYMAPEYAMGGVFSFKSDVFSFGVLLLEIISGKKNNNFHVLQPGESLVTFAWKLWSQGIGTVLIDPLLRSCVDKDEALRCIHIGLLCVQDDPAGRPSMSTVTVMLANQTMVLPLPAQPAFSVGRVVEHSVNEVTISNLSPR